MYRVMIVEDEMLVRIGLEHSIDWVNYGLKVVSTVSNGVEAYEQYLELRPHLIITDIKMPKMDGIELITKIRAQDKQIKFIILTCMEDFKTAKSALDNAVSFYFVKSDMKMDEIKEAVKLISEDLKNSQVGFEEKSRSNFDLHEELKLWLADEKTLLPDCFLQYKEENSTFILSQITIYDINDGSDDSSKRRLYKFVINTLEELIKTQKIGRLLFIDSEKAYILHTLKNNSETNKVINDLQYIADMIKSYFNLEMTAIVTQAFENIEKVKEQFTIINNYSFISFYCNDSIVSIENQGEKLCMDKVKAGINKIINYYEDNFYAEYIEEFSKFVNKFDATIITKIKLLKEFFIQWIQIFIERMHLVTKEAQQSNVEVVNCINSSANCDNMVDCFIHFMDNVKNDEGNKKRMSIGLTGAISYINKNLKYNITLPMVAENVNLSPGYLSYLFTSELNMSFTHFVMKLRIKTAQNMLAQTAEKLYVVAEEVGFSDPGYFNKTFKKYTGMTPSQYRKQNFKGYKYEM